MQSCRHAWLLLALVLWPVLVPTGARADKSEGHDLVGESQLYTAFGYVWLSDLVWGKKAPKLAAKQPRIRAATFRTSNFGATLEKGEPTEGGKMKRTVWGRLSVPDKARIVVHTFGSSFDSVLAVYRGTTIKELDRVAGNDDTPAGSFGHDQSLVQFDAVKGKDYSVQIGSKTGAEGDVLANVFIHPPEGGLSAFLVEALGNSSWWNRDLVCGNGPSLLPGCTGSATFLVHNSTDKTLSVEASHDLGAGIDAPPDFTLKPGEIKEASFTFTGGFDSTKPRTTAGQFYFKGVQAGKVVGEFKTRVLIVIKPTGGLPDVLEALATPIVTGGHVNEVLTFDVELKNTGNKAALGCHARSQALSNNQAAWESSGDLFEPFDISAGKSRTMRIHVASQEARIADPTFPTASRIEIDCYNTALAFVDLQNSFDFTARGAYRPNMLLARKLSPSGDTLKVPRSGEASFEVEAENEDGEATIVARAQYAKPFDENAPNEQFAVSVCRLEKPKGKCVGPTAESVEYLSKKGAKDALRVFVKGPKKDPGFDPGLRRVFLILSQKQPVGFVYSVPIAAASVAPQKQ